MDEIWGYEPETNDDVFHYGKKYRSGRYPYGSGEDPYQHDPHGFYTRYRQLKSEGKTEQEICYELGYKDKDGSVIPLSSGQLRAKVSAAKEQEIIERNNKILALKEHGYSNVEIGKKLGINESVVRSTIQADKEGKIGRAQNTADMLKRKVEEKGVIDIGAGVNIECGVSETKWDTAVQMLADQGYEVHNIKVEQATNPGNFTTVKVLAKPGTKWEDIYYNLDVIKTVGEYSPNGGDDFHPLIKPKMVDPSRVYIRYGNEGGSDKDGTIELRPGVADLSMGNSTYSQVRIGVDGEGYMKGMAFYNDDIPEGYDIVYNVHYNKGDKIFKSFKEEDPTNPFGALLKPQGQTWYVDDNGNETISVVNKIKEEGDWEDYSKNLASQFLAKQDKKLIKQQLDLTLQGKQNEYEDILNCENEAIRQKLLIDFANECDSASVHLKSVPLPGQSTKVLLPITSLKDNECYCPSLPDGQEVCLVRYPHGGTFEIPRLTNNLRNKEGKNIIGNKAIDVIGINKAAAGILSGADFDGDVAIVIPTGDNRSEIKNSTLEALRGFDPQEAYPYTPGQRKCWEKGSSMEQKQMGMVSNLITDMTIQGASEDELARAVKHSMVVIDTGKHKLNYHQSELDNDIQSLKDKYQNPNNKAKGGGASTLLSRASGDIRIPEVKYEKINKDTGEIERIYTNRKYMEYKKEKDSSGKIVNWSEGKLVEATQKSKNMLEVKDAFELSSGSEKEALYANFANSLKSLALQARKEAMSTKTYKVDDDIKEVYQKEISDLNTKLKLAKTNAPRERAAQIKAADAVNKYKKKYKEEGKEYIKDDKAKLANRTLQNARIEYGAQMSGEKGRSIKLTEKEWKAINDKAVSASLVKQIMDYMPSDDIQKYAMPKKETSISVGKQAMIKSMVNNQYSLAEIADALNISVSTVSKYANQ